MLEGADMVMKAKEKFKYDDLFQSEEMLNILILFQLYWRSNQSSGLFILTGQIVSFSTAHTGKKYDCQSVQKVRRLTPCQIKDNFRMSFVKLTPKSILRYFSRKNDKSYENENQGNYVKCVYFI